MNGNILSLHERLIHEGLVDEEKMAEVKDRMDMGMPLEKALLEVTDATEGTVLETLSRILHMEFVPSLSEVNVPSVFLEKVPVEFARKFSIVAIDQNHGTVRVTTSRPLNYHLNDELFSLLESDVETVVSPSAEIDHLIGKAYQARNPELSNVLDDISDANMEGIAREVEETEDLIDVAHKAPVVRLVNSVLTQALKERSTDIHFQPFEDSLRIRSRVDGLLYDMMEAPKSLHEAVISRIKVMGKMNIAERRAAQDGRATIRFADQEVDIRISIVPTSFGERAVLRLLNKSEQLLTLPELGLNEGNVRIIRRLIEKPYGIIYVTGPTGSGKTTSLYAYLTCLNAKEKNILTIEDPIEYQLPGISQVQVLHEKDMTFAKGLRTFVRQDPDIIMVGEVRDEETAAISIQSALTGHLVFTTMHTNDSAGGVTRLLDFGAEPYLICSSTIAVIAQRLVRRICPHCKESYTPESAVLREIGIPMNKIKDGKLFRGRGCSECLGRGYLGRTAIFEILEMSDSISELIMQRVSASVIKKEGLKCGLTTLRMDGIEKIIKGETTIEEVVNITQPDIFGVGDTVYYPKDGIVK